MSDSSGSNLPSARLDRSSLERVLARAAELQSTSGDTVEEFTEEQLLELGREVGLSPQNLRQALAEERTRSSEERSRRADGRFEPEESDMSKSYRQIVRQRTIQAIQRIPSTRRHGFKRL